MIEGLYNKKRFFSFSLIATFLLFFISDDALLFSTIPSMTLLVTKIVLYVGLFAILLSRPCLDFSGLRRGGAICGIFLFFLAISMAWNSDFTLNFGYRFFIFVLCLLFATRVRFEDYVQAFLKILFFFSLITIAFWVVSRVAPGVVAGFPTFVNSKGHSFSTIFVCSFLGESSRAISIFREPGVFAVYLIWGLLLELFYLPRPSKWRPLVFSTAIVFTFSTLGFICILAMYSIFIVRAKEGFLFFKKNWWVLILGVIGIVVLFSNDYVYTNAFMRNFGEDDIAGSTAFSRVASITVPFHILMNHPFFGVGITSYLDFQEQSGLILYGLYLGDGTGTNTIMIETAKHGVFYGMILFYLLYRTSCRVGGRGVITLGIFLLLLAMFSSQCMPYSVFYSLLLMYGATYIENQKSIGVVGAQRR